MIKNELKNNHKEDLSDEVVFYCTRCMSLHIISENDGKELYCASCGKRRSKPQYLDVTTLDKWIKLYKNAYGHHPLADDPNPYTDLRESYEEDTYNPEPTKEEIYQEGLNYSEVMNRKIRV